MKGSELKRGKSCLITSLPSLASLCDKIGEQHEHSIPGFNTSPFLILVGCVWFLHSRKWPIFFCQHFKYFVSVLIQSIFPDLTIWNLDSTTISMMKGEACPRTLASTSWSFLEDACSPACERSRHQTHQYRTLVQSAQSWHAYHDLDGETWKSWTRCQYHDPQPASTKFLVRQTRSKALQRGVTLPTFPSTIDHHPSTLPMVTSKPFYLHHAGACTCSPKDGYAILESGWGATTFEYTSTRKTKNFLGTRLSQWSKTKQDERDSKKGCSEVCNKIMAKEILWCNWSYLHAEMELASTKDCRRCSLCLLDGGTFGLSQLLSHDGARHPVESVQLSDQSIRQDGRTPCCAHMPPDETCDQIRDSSRTVHLTSPLQILCRDVSHADTSCFPHIASRRRQWCPLTICLHSLQHHYLPRCCGRW